MGQHSRARNPASPTQPAGGEKEKKGKDVSPLSSLRIGGEGVRDFKVPKWHTSRND